MPRVYWRQYGEATTINLPAFYAYATGQDLVTSAVHAAGDTTIMIDEGTPANTTNGFVDEGDFYSLALTALELTGKRIQIKVADQGSPTWLPYDLVIETFGHPSAQDPRGVLLRDTAAAIASGSITLASSALATDDAYNNCVVEIVSNGTAAANGQMRYISDYVGSTKVASISSNWTTLPTGTVIYRVWPAPFGTSDVNVASLSTGAVNAAALATDAVDEIVAGWMAASLNGTVTNGSAKEALVLARNDFSISADGLTLTVRKPDGTTHRTYTLVRFDQPAVRSMTPT
jgi:hypothetical protein